MAGRITRSINPKRGFWASSKGRNYIDVRTGPEGETKRERYGFRQLGVEYIYGKSSRVVRGTSTLLGVRLKTGERGWLGKGGIFMSERDIENVAHSLDSTFAVANLGFSFEDLWKRMSAAQRAQVAEKLWGVDWDAFWNENYEPDNPFAADWLSEVYAVVDIFNEVVNG